MISKKDIIRIVDHIIRRSQGYTDRREMHPAREWMTGLVGVFVLFVFASSFAGYKLFVLMQSGAYGEFEEGTVVTLNQEDIVSILSAYEKRKSTFEALRTDRSHATLQSVTEDQQTEDGTAEAASDEPAAQLAE